MLSETRVLAPNSKPETQAISKYTQLLTKQRPRRTKRKTGAQKDQGEQLSLLDTFTTDSGEAIATRYHHHD